QVAGNLAVSLRDERSLFITEPGVAIKPRLSAGGEHPRRAPGRTPPQRDQRSEIAGRIERAHVVRPARVAKVEVSRIELELRLADNAISESLVKAGYPREQKRELDPL